MNKEIQDMLNDLPNKKFSKLSDKQLEGYERLKHLPRNEEWRKKIGAAHKGKKVSKKTLEKMSKASTGRKHSDETKEKCRQKSIGLNIGRKHSDEARKKHSEVAKKRKYSEETRKKMAEKKKNNPQINDILKQARKIANAKLKKPILCYTYPDKKFVKEYAGTIDAAKELDINKNGITYVLKKKYKQIKGYYFEYKN